MSETISEITPEQEARIPEWVEKWVKIGLSTAPLDFYKAEQAALKAYQLAGLKKPKIILRLSSPYEAIKQGYLASKYLNLQDESQIWSKIWSKIWLKPSSQVKSHVESKVEAKVRSQIESQVWSRVESKVGSQIDSQIWSKIDSQFKKSTCNLHNGASWASGCAHISFIRDVLNWQDPILENFKIHEDLVTYCGYVWWHEDVLVISDRPKQIHQDNQGELHSETGPALVYRDGYAQWYWHGVAVPQVVIEKPQDITVEMIDKET